MEQGERLKAKDCFLDMDKRSDRISRAFLKNKKISTENKKVILDFIAYKTSEGISKVRTSKLLSNLNSIFTKFASKTFNIKEAEEQELRRLVTNVLESDLSVRTQDDFKGVLKQVYKFLNGGEEFPKKVRFIKQGLKKSQEKIPEDLITKKELEKLIDVCKNARDKAIISMLYESGARIGEFGELKIKHCQFDQNGFKLTLPSGKTGGRCIRLVESERRLRNWLEDHPDKNNPEAWLWVKISNSETTFERMYYDTIRMMVKKKGIQANIKTYRTANGGTFTKIHPHLFRHSRATELAKKLTEQQLKLFFGWTRSSEMASVYVHLSGRDVDDAILKSYGIKSQDEIQDAIRCQSCGRPNPSTVDICQTCFRPLNIKSALEVDQANEKASKLISALIRGEINISDIKKYVQRN